MILLLRVAENLAWVFGSDDIKKLVLRANLQEIAMILLYELFKDAVFGRTRSILVLDSISISFSSRILLRLLLIGT